MSRSLSTLSTLIATGLLTTSVTAQCQVQKITQNTPGANNNFGINMWVDGEVMIVGQVNDDWSGSASCYRFDGTTWAYEGTVLQPDGLPDDAFGAPALSGDHALVGAFFHDNAATNDGAVYAYRYNGATWDFVQKLTPNDPVDNGYFGIVLNVVGDTASISASEAVYIYRHGVLGWQLEAKLTSGVEPAGYGYPAMLSSCGNVVVVGSYQSDHAVEYGGAAFVYRRDVCGTWNLEGILTASDAQTSDIYGLATSCDTNLVAVGALAEDSAALDAGAVYVYRNNGKSWVEEQKITMPDPVVNAGFGNDVVIRGDRLLVGAADAEVDGEIRGAAYLYKYDGATWNLVKKITGSDSEAGDWFANVVAMDGDVIACGGRLHDGSGTDAGAAYVFAGAMGADYNGNGTPDVCEAMCPGDSNGDGTVNATDLLWLLSIWGGCP